MPRQGRSAIFSFDAIPAKGARVGVRFHLDHKDARDDSWSELAHVEAAVPGRTSIHATDIKERVRLRFEAHGPGSGDAARIRIWPPEWGPR